MNAKENKRKLKANMILNTCKKKYQEAEGDEDKGVDKKLMVSSVCLEWGAGQRYVKEIISDLINLKKLIETENKLYWVVE